MADQERILPSVKVGETVNCRELVAKVSLFGEGQRSIQFLFGFPQMARLLLEQRHVSRRKYLEVFAGHLTTPVVARGQVIDWINAL